MLTPTDRLDRGLFLDVVIFYQLYQVGVNDLHMESSKEFSGGTVCMTIDFARASDPSTDKFIVEVKDHAGHNIREETYSGAEVLGQVQMMSRSNATTRPDGQPTEDAAAHAEMLEARLRQIMAATQPADAPPSTRPATPDSFNVFGNVPRISR